MMFSQGSTGPMKMCKFVMLNMENGMSPEEAAAKWIENNPEKVNEWLGE